MAQKKKLLNAVYNWKFDTDWWSKKSDISEAENLDLSEVNLSRACLNDVTLENVDFTGTDLYGANLSSSWFAGGMFTDVLMQNAKLHRAKLQYAQMERATLAYANLNHTQLTGVNLRDSDLSGADLSYANLSGANLFRANLFHAYFYHVNLSGADLSNAIMRETVFINCNLTSVVGLESVKHGGPSTIDHRTIQQSGGLPDSFLRGSGMPESLVEYYPSLLNQPISFYSCFISYSHNDKAFARRLHDALQGRGIRCWLDEHQLLPGDDVYKEVDQLSLIHI